MTSLRIATLIAMSLAAYQLCNLGTAEACTPSHAPTACASPLPAFAFLDGMVLAGPFVVANMMPGERGRGYGAAELVINAPLGVLWAMAATDNDSSEFGIVAAVHGGLALHGAWTLLRRREVESPPTIRVGRVRASLAPTAVSDGRDVAGGMMLRGTF